MPRTDGSRAVYSLAQRLVTDLACTVSSAPTKSAPGRVNKRPDFARDCRDRRFFLFVRSVLRSLRYALFGPTGRTALQRVPDPSARKAIEAQPQASAGCGLAPGQ